LIFDLLLLISIIICYWPRNGPVLFFLLASVGWPPGTWVVWWPTLHGGPVQLRPTRANPCF